jgi:hypothetical protein
MKIKQVDKATIYYVETDEKDWHYYIRHGADSWCLLMGESWEIQYDCEELEKEFQEWLYENS